MNTFENTETLQNQLRTFEAKRLSISKSFTIFSTCVLILIILSLIFKAQFQVFVLLGGVSVLILMAIVMFGFIYYFMSKIAVNIKIQSIQNELATLEPTKFTKKSEWPIIIGVVIVLLLTIIVSAKFGL